MRALLTFYRDLSLYFARQSSRALRNICSSWSYFRKVQEMQEKLLSCRLEDRIARAGRGRESVDAEARQRKSSYSRMWIDWGRIYIYPVRHIVLLVTSLPLLSSRHLHFALLSPSTLSIPHLSPPHPWTNMPSLGIATATLEGYYKQITMTFQCCHNNWPNMLRDKTRCHQGRNVAKRYELIRYIYFRYTYYIFYLRDI